MLSALARRFDVAKNVIPATASSSATVSARADIVTRRHPVTARLTYADIGRSDYISAASGRAPVNKRNSKSGERRTDPLADMKAQALELARERQPMRTELRVEETIAPFLGGVAIIVKFRKPKGAPGRDLFYFSGDADDAGVRRPRRLANLEELARFVEDWSWQAARSEVGLLRAKLEDSVAGPDREAVSKKLDAAQQAARDDDKHGFIEQMRDALSMAKDVADLAEKLGPVGSVLLPFLRGMVL
jgi:hypothetical protein